MRKELSHALMIWVYAQREDRGDAFATETEVESMLSDPLAFADMLKGVDAYKFIETVLNLTENL
jgi:hypothetical protein